MQCAIQDAIVFFYLYCDDIRKECQFEVSDFDGNIGVMSGWIIVPLNACCWCFRHKKKNNNKGRRKSALV